jgi:hypothetical protein
MLILLVAPVWVAIIGMCLAWGMDPYSSWAITVYIMAGLTSFFAMLLSEA